MHPHIRPIKSVAKVMDGRCSILNIRVRVSSTNGNLAQIFGFPPQEYFPKSMWYAPPELGRDGPYIKYLLGQSSASINTQDGLAVLEEERAHSLRMHRCGAVTICAESDIGYYDDEQMNMWPMYLFGWPGSGGVWVMRPPWSEDAPEASEDDSITGEEIMEQTVRMAEKEDVYFALKM